MENNSHDSRQLEDFLRWFLDLAVIPAETKALFAKHLIDAGEFDEVAQMYVAIVMEYLTALSTQETNEAKAHLEQIQEAIAQEQSPETSLRAKSVAHATERMEQLASAFRESLQNYQTEQMASGEAEDLEEADEIKRKIQ